MSLDEYTVERDEFELDLLLGSMAQDFPCILCEHRLKLWGREKPCLDCDHAVAVIARREKREDKWNENVETCSNCGIEWKKIGEQCPVCYAPAEKQCQ